MRNQKVHSQQIKDQKGVSLVFGLLAMLAIPALIPSSAHADTLDYTVTIQGGRLSMQGGNLNVLINLVPANTAIYAGTVNLTFLNLPPGVTYRMPRIDAGTCCGAYPNYGLFGIGNGAEGDWLQLTSLPSTPKGDYTITVQASITGSPSLTRSSTFVMTVMAPGDFALTQGPALPAQPIPHKTDWETTMAATGGLLCDKNSIDSQGTYDGSVWYYDGARVFYQIGDYRNESSWSTNCARWVADMYGSAVEGNNGGEQGYHVFTKGFRMDVQRTGNAVSKQSISLLAKSDGYYETARDAVWPGNMRESSYGLEAMMDDKTINGTSYPMIEQQMEALLGELDQIFIQKQWSNTYWQPFMIGLAMEALIQYYNEINPDPRIPYIIKQTLDGMWQTAWSPSEHGFAYQCWPVQENGTYCYNSSNPDYQSTMPPPGPYTHDVLPNLNLLIAPAYAWMYLQTHDVQYREKGDTLFADGVIYADVERGKEFSQNYRWSFDYVNWRNQANAQAGPLPTSVPPPSVTVVAPVSGAVMSGPTLLTADASGSTALSVQFQIDGVNAGPPATIEPFETTVNTSLFANGTHSLTAIVYDQTGQQTTSVPVPVTISNAANASFQQCPSTNLPTGAFQGCYYNYSVGDDNTAFNDMYSNSNLGTLAKVEQDASVSFSGGGSPAAGINNSFFGVIWQGNFSFPKGTYAFSFTQTTMGARFYIDNQLLTGPASWNPDNAASLTSLQTFPVDGTHLIRIEAWVGFTKASDAVQLSWQAGTPGSTPPTPPSIAWTFPAYGASYLTGSNVPLITKAFGFDGKTISKVDFFQGATLLGTATNVIGNGQYQFVWPQVPAGTYLLYATVTDSSGMTAQAIAGQGLQLTLGDNFPAPPPPLSGNPPAIVPVQFSNLNAVKVYPNPWRSDRHAGKSITFDNLSQGVTIKIFTVSGHKIKDVNISGSIATWDLTNNSGEKVGSGIYLYVVKDAQGNKAKGKLAVIK